MDKTQQTTMVLAHMPIEFQNEAIRENTDALKSIMVSLVIGKLLEPSNIITSKELKNSLRERFPEIIWNQQDVTEYLEQLHTDGLFSYSEDGDYRVYSSIEYAEELAEGAASAQSVAEEDITAETETVVVNPGLGSTYSQVDVHRGHTYKNVRVYNKVHNQYRAQTAGGTYFRFTSSNATVTL